MLPIGFNWISLYLFIILLSVLIYIYRKKLEFQKILPPLIYLGLFRTKLGINFIDKVSKKYKEFIKIYGLSGIGFGFIGMLFIAYLMIKTIFYFISKPSPDLVKPLLPQTNYPGLGFLNFWYFIICLFVVIIIHEFSHGIVAKANGIKIKKSGIGFLAILVPLFPLAFVEPDENDMKKAKDHVKYSVFAAGPFSNLITAGIISLLFLFIFMPLDSHVLQKDGVTFSPINDSYPSKILPSNFTLRIMNGNNITDLNSFVKQMQFINPKETVNLSNGTTDYLLNTVPNPEDSSKAFIGVHNFINEVKIKEGVNKTGYYIYKWIRDLFKWMGLISFAVGIMNLLPMSITDGGQMFNLMFSRIFDKNKFAQKVGIYISFFFILIMIFFLVYWIISIISPLILIIFGLI